MKKKRLDMEKYPRKEHFRYFMKMAYPYVGITVNVDITNWTKKRKEAGNPFFLSFLYEVIHAANAVPEIRQRIYEDGIIEFENCKASYTVALDNGTYCYCSVSGNHSLEEFLVDAKKEQENAKKNPSLTDGEEGLSLLFISSLPWITYTAMVQPVPCPADSNPRITWGKYFEQEDRILIPVTLLCHHALVDGIHMNMFYEKLNVQLKNEVGD